MDTRTKMNRALYSLSRAQDAVLKAAREVFDIQAACEHSWCFVRQVNAYHINLWNVVWKCQHCDTEQVDKEVPPICTDCQEELKRVSKDDAEAEAERVKPEHQGYLNPPEAWRCTACRKIHILHLNGD